MERYGLGIEVYFNHRCIIHLFQIVQYNFDLRGLCGDIHIYHHTYNLQETNTNQTLIQKHLLNLSDCCEHVKKGIDKAFGN